MPPNAPKCNSCFLTFLKQLAIMDTQEAVAAHHPDQGLPLTAKRPLNNWKKDEKSFQKTFLYHQEGMYLTRKTNSLRKHQRLPLKF